MTAITDPESVSELSMALETLINRAQANGVPIDTRSFTHRHYEEQVPDWEIEITLLESLETT